MDRYSSVMFMCNTHLLIAQKDWKDSGITGVLTLVTCRKLKANVIRIYNSETCQNLFELEMYEGFAKKCLIGERFILVPFKEYSFCFLFEDAADVADCSRTIFDMETYYSQFIPSNQEEKATKKRRGIMDFVISGVQSFQMVKHNNMVMENVEGEQVYDILYNHSSSVTAIKRSTHSSSSVSKHQNSSLDPTPEKPVNVDAVINHKDLSTPSCDRPELPELPELPDLPDISDLPDLPDISEMGNPLEMQTEVQIVQENEQQQGLPAIKKEMSSNSENRPSFPPSNVSTSSTTSTGSTTSTTISAPTIPPTLPSLPSRTISLTAGLVPRALSAHYPSPPSPISNSGCPPSSVQPRSRQASNDSGKYDSLHSASSTATSGSIPSTTSNEPNHHSNHSNHSNHSKGGSQKPFPAKPGRSVVMKASMRPSARPLSSALPQPMNSLRNSLQSSATPPPIPATPPPALHSSTPTSTLTPTSASTLTPSRLPPHLPAHRPLRGGGLSQHSVQSTPNRQPLNTRAGMGGLGAKSSAVTTSATPPPSTLSGPSLRNSLHNKDDENCDHHQQQQQQQQQQYRYHHPFDQHETIRRMVEEGNGEEGEEEKERQALHQGLLHFTFDDLEGDLVMKQQDLHQPHPPLPLQNQPRDLNRGVRDLNGEATLPLNLNPDGNDNGNSEITIIGPQPTPPRTVTSNPDLMNMVRVSEGVVAGGTDLEDSRYVEREMLYQNNRFNLTDLLGEEAEECTQSILCASPQYQQFQEGQRVRGVSELSDLQSLPACTTDNFISEGTRGGFCGPVRNEHQINVEQIRQFKRQNNQWGQPVGPEETEDLFVIDDAEDQLMRESYCPPLCRPTTFTVITEGSPRETPVITPSTIKEEILPLPEVIYAGRSKESIMIMNDCDNFAFREDSDSEDSEAWEGRSSQYEQQQAQVRGTSSNHSSSQCTPHSTLLPSVMSHIRK